MAKDVRQALAELVARKDAAVFQSVERFAREMEALVGRPAAEIKALAIGLEARLPWTLRKATDSTSLGHLADELELIHGLPRPQAWWTIETWAYALVITLPPRPADPAAAPGAPPSSPPPPPPPPSVSSRAAPGAPGGVPATPGGQTGGGPRPPSLAGALPNRPAGPPGSRPAAPTPSGEGPAGAARPAAVAASRTGAPAGATPSAGPAGGDAGRASGVVPPPATPLGIEFQTGGAEGLFRVARVWSDPDAMSGPRGLALAQPVKAEDFVPRPLPVSAVPPRPASRAGKAVLSAAGATSAVPSAGPASPAPNPPVAQKTPTTSDAPSQGAGVSRGPETYPRPGAAAAGPGSDAGCTGGLSSAAASAASPAGRAPAAAPPSVEKFLGPVGPVPTPATPEAQYQLARDLLEGVGRPVNLSEGVRLLRLAALHDHVPAWFTLGMVCLRGYGQKEDPAEAARWFRKSAETGNADAMVQLGILYQSGRGVPIDFLEARRWFAAAAQKGHPEAAARLKKLP